MRGDDAEGACLQGGGSGFVAEVAQMTVDHVRLDEQPAALDRSGHRFDDVGRPRARTQPGLRRGITKVEMHPHEIHVARSDVELFKLAQCPPSPAAECKGKQRMVVCHALHGAVGPARCRHPWLESVDHLSNPGPAFRSLPLRMQRRGPPAVARRGRHRSRARGSWSTRRQPRCPRAASAPELHRAPGRRRR